MVASDLIKVASLLAGLITFAGLIRHSELTAIWGAGVSQLGLVRRLLPVALLLGALQFAVDDVAVPASADALTEWGVGEYGRQQRAHNGREFTWIQVGTEVEIGRAHVRTPVTNAYLGSRIMLEQKHKYNPSYLKI